MFTAGGKEVHWDQAGDALGCGNKKGLCTKLRLCIPYLHSSLGSGTMVASKIHSKCWSFLILGACVQVRPILKRELNNTSLIKGKEVL